MAELYRLKEYTLQLARWLQIFSTLRITASTCIKLPLILHTKENLMQVQITAGNGLTYVFFCRVGNVIILRNFWFSAQWTVRWIPYFCKLALGFRFRRLLICTVQSHFHTNILGPPHSLDGTFYPAVSLFTTVLIPVIYIKGMSWRLALLQRIHRTAQKKNCWEVYVQVKQRWLLLDRQRRWHHCIVGLMRSAY